MARVPKCYGAGIDYDKRACSDCALKDKCSSAYLHFSKHPTVHDARRMELRSKPYLMTLDEAVKLCVALTKQHCNSYRNYYMSDRKTGQQKYLEAVRAALEFCVASNVNPEIFLKSQFIMLSPLWRNGLVIQPGHLWGKGAIDRHYKYAKAQLERHSALEHLKKAEVDKMVDAEVLYGTLYVRSRMADEPLSIKKIVKEVKKKHPDWTRDNNKGRVEALAKVLNSIHNGLAKRVALVSEDWTWKEVVKIVKAMCVPPSGAEEEVELDEDLGLRR